MVFQRGDVVLIPFPYTDLSSTKTHPAVVVSSERYHAVRPDLLVAYVSSQIQQADPDIDHVIVDWQGANLLKPSFVRPNLTKTNSGLIYEAALR
jgi:mRNA interferase MazF